MYNKNLVNYFLHVRNILDFLYFFIIYILCEFFEIIMHSGNSFSSYLANLLRLYQRGIVKFLLYNPTFFIALLSLLQFDKISFSIILLLTCKFLDISLKIALLDKISNNKPLGNLSVLFQEDMKIPTSFKILISCFYITLFYIAFNI